MILNRNARHGGPLVTMDSRLSALLLSSVAFAIALKYDLIWATKGELFIYQLHSGNFFPRADEKIDWTASIIGGKRLPSWMRLEPSPYQDIVFLFGTPDTAVSRYDIEVTARSREEFFVSRTQFTLQIEQNGKYNGSISQIAQLVLRNLDSWELLFDRQLALQLEKRVKQAFPNDLPYIQDLETLADGKIGTLVKIASKRGFSRSVLVLAEGLLYNPNHCHKNQLIPLDSHFSPVFSIDWCSFKVFDSDGSKIQSYQGAPVRAKPIEWFRNSNRSAVKRSQDYFLNSAYCFKLSELVVLILMIALLF